jgi:predicted aldo/keto reductase-like oxidoreductase
MAIERRKLGKTDAMVSEIALGGGQLHRSSPKTVAAVIGEALDHGVNYIDVAQMAGQLAVLRAALSGRRQEVMLAVHPDGLEAKGQVRVSRDTPECEQNFTATLSQLQTDYADVVFITHVDEEGDYQELSRAGAILELALRWKQEGKARSVGISCHKVPIAMQAVESDHFDVLMFPINPAFDCATWESGLTGGRRVAEGMPLRKELYLACAAREIGLIAMKPFFGGAYSHRGSRGMPLTPVQCLSYALSQPGVSAVAAGVKDVNELRATVAYVQAPEQERDFAEAVAKAKWDLQGNCLYCSHCLPCPSGIDIAEVMRLLDVSRHGPSRDLRSHYRAQPAPASACSECGVCEERCPFDVPVVEKLKRVVAEFEVKSR